MISAVLFLVGVDTCCAWAGGTFLPVVLLVVSVFWLWREIVLGVTYLPYQLCCCIFLLVAVGNGFGLHRSTDQFFGCGRK